MAVNTDFYAPDVLIKINGQQFRHGMTTVLQSVSITETVNKADTFEVVLRGHHPQYERFASGGELEWIDDSNFEEGNKVEIELGYINNRSLKFVGKISGVTISYPEGGTPTLNVRGLSRYNDLHRVRRREPFDAATDSGIASEIAGIVGLTAAVDATSEEHSTVSPNGSTLAEFLQNRAKRIDYELTVKQNTLIFQKPRYKVDITPNQILTWGENLLTFSPNLSNSRLPTETEVRNTQTSIGGAKEAISGKVTSSEVKPRLGSTSGLELSKKKFGDNRVLSTDQRVKTQQEARTVARAYMEQQAIEYITGNGSTIGNPELVSRQVIELKRLGARFSGKYYITSTTHRIDTNGYRTNFSVKRDGQ